MTKFKVGDKVKIIRESHKLLGNTIDSMGSFGEIIEMCDASETWGDKVIGEHYFVRLTTGDRWYLSPSMMELVK